MYKNRLQLARATGCLALILVYFLTAVSQTRRTGFATPPLRTITIATEPNAAVWIDGVRYGTTSEDGKLTISSIAPGVRSARIRASGFKETTKSLTAAQKGEVAIPLTKTTDPAELAFQKADALTSVDREKATEGFLEAIKLRPKYVEAYIGLARIYSETGDHEKAEKALKDLKRIRPGLAEASAIEGRLLKDLDDEKRAVATFKRAITEGKGFQPEAYTGLGLLYKEKAETFGGAADYAQEAANYTEAAKYLTVAAKQLGGAPDAIVVYQLLGLVYERQKKYTNAINVYEEFLRVFPDSNEAGAVQSFIVQLRKQMTQPE